jgi:myo-inositol-1(or 4)-monophosphatase
MLDLAHALTVATQASLKAGERITQGYEEKLEITTKSDKADRVTQVDTDAQNIIFEIIQKAFPDHAFLGEEENASQSDQESEYQWIIDPLDGTMNFTHRLPFTGVSMALRHNDETVLGVLNFPALGYMYTATKGGGAQKNGKPISVSGCKKFDDAMIAEIFSDRESRGKKVQYPHSAAFRKFGSAITSLAFVSDGSVDGTVLRCRLWDVAASEVIIQEAGGKVLIKFDDEGDVRGALTCIASTPEIHRELIEFVNLNIKRLDTP